MWKAKDSKGKRGKTTVHVQLKLIAHHIKLGIPPALYDIPKFFVRYFPCTVVAHILCLNQQSVWGVRSATDLLDKAFAYFRTGFWDFVTFSTLRRELTWSLFCLVLTLAPPGRVLAFLLSQVRCLLIHLNEVTFDRVLTKIFGPRKVERVPTVRRTRMTRFHKRGTYTGKFNGGGKRQRRSMHRYKCWKGQKRRNSRLLRQVVPVVLKDDAIATEEVCTSN